MSKAKALFAQLDGYFNSRLWVRVGANLRRRDYEPARRLLDELGAELFPHKEEANERLLTRSRARTYSFNEEGRK